MKIAITGKGGVGKTTIAGTLARLMSRDGLRVIAVDMDPNTNLAYTLGLNEEQANKIIPLSINRELLKKKMEVYPGSLEAGFFRLYPKVDDIIEQYGVECPDNVTLLVMGTIRDGGIGCLCPAHALMRALLRHLILKR
ncbi:MAG: AAA family ATPase, partial [archaeon GB-1867-035]|nr:AAA family ATPase [Candidatus Culexmicrobium profundum]